MGLSSGKREMPLDLDLEALIEKVSTGCGFDLRGYRRSTLYRRIRKRMGELGFQEVSHYLARLDADPYECSELVDTILINVTEFLRDPFAWHSLQRHCLQPLARTRHPGEPIRAWCAGCATGEEAYSLAMLLVECLGEQRMESVKIYATDMDERALSAARLGLFAPTQMRNVSPDRFQRFFEPLEDGRAKVRPVIRSSVIFGRHNVLVDPPISRLDLLVCRNLLIYFDAKTQQQMMSRFHYSLAEGGTLFLGKAETLMTRSHLFQSIDVSHRLFRRLAAPSGARFGPGCCLPRD